MNNMQVLQTNILETANKISEINIRSLIFAAPNSENTFTVSCLMGVLRTHSNIAEYATLRNSIFNEYFENRKYLLECYLVSIARIFEKDAVKAHEFLGGFLAKYLELISEE